MTASAPTVRRLTAPGCCCDLWIFRMVDDVRNFPHEFLSPEELARARRYLSVGKRRQFLVTRGFGRLILSHYFDSAPERLNWPPSGPPRVTNERGERCVEVSVSHSGKSSILAIAAPGRGIGIDIEDMSAPLNAPALARVALHAEEQKWLEQFPDDRQETVLRRLWTLKEAVLKSTGIAGEIPLPGIDLLPALTGQGAPRIPEAGESCLAGWSGKLKSFESCDGTLIPIPFHPDFSVSGFCPVPHTLCGGLACADVAFGEHPQIANCWNFLTHPDEPAEVLHRLKKFGVQATVSFCVEDVTMNSSATKSP